MDAITIAKAKEIRESLGATHLVLFAVGADGQQHVKTAKDDLCGHFEPNA